MHIGFNQYGQFRDILVFFCLGHQLFQSGRCTSGGAFFFGQICAVIRNFASLCFGIHNVKHIPGFGCAIQAKHFDRNRRTSGFNPLAFIVNQRPDFTPLLTNNEDITLVQRAFLHQNRCHWPTADIQLRFNHSALRCTIRVGFKLKNFCLKGDGFEQFIQALSIDGRNLNILNFTRKLFHDNFMLQQISAHFVWVGFGLVDFVNRNNHRHLGGFGVINRLDGLRHNRIIGCHHQHHNIGHLRTA